MTALPLRFFDRLVRGAEKRPFHPLQIYLAGAWVAGVRFLEEKAFVYDAVERRFPQNDLGIIIAWVVFYAALGICITAVLTHVGKLDWQRSWQAVAYGLTLAVLPPLIDVWVYGPGNFYYRYQEEFFADMTFLLFNAEKGLPIGETVAVWLAIGFTGLYAWRKGAAPWRAGLCAFGVYLLGVFFGVLLPKMALALQALPGANRFGDKWLMAWVGLAVALVGYLILRPALLREGWKRLPQILLGPALVLLGGAWIGRIDVVTVLAAIMFGAMTTVFALTNLYYDREEDAAGGHTTGVEATDVSVLHVWAALIIVTLMRHHVFLALCLAMFLIAAYAYHADPMRTKCVFPLSYKSEGFFAAAAFFAGIVCQRTYRLQIADVVVAALLFGGFSIASFFKDAKDVDGDEAAGVMTLYVLFRKRGWGFRPAHAVAVTSLALCLAVPPIWLAMSARASGGALAAIASLAAVTVGATLLPQRRLGVGLGVSGVTLYVALLAWALLPAA